MPDTPVSVVIPAYNEQRWIRDCLDSLLRGDYSDLEVLVIDGGSSDRTREIVQTVAVRDHRVRLLSNPRRTAAAAMNIGLAKMQHDLLVRADAHAVYGPDYVRRNVDTLHGSGAGVVGGPMRPVGTTRFGRAVAAATTTRVGMGSGAFHWTQRPRIVDTVYLGCYRRADLLEVGGWDDQTIQRAAEDQELNFRLRQRGHRILCDPAIESWYYTRPTPRALWQQYRNYGVCKASTLAKHSRLPTVRSVAPAALVATLASAIVAAGVRRRPLLALPAAAWATALAATGLRLSRSPEVDAARATLALGICHLAHGVGFWAGLLRIVSGRSFDTGPVLDATAGNGSS